MTKLDFPTLADAIRLATIRKWERLYQGEYYKEFGIKDYFVDSQRNEELLYIAVNIAAVVSDYFADMVSGKDVIIVASDESEQEFYDEFKAENDLNKKVFEVALDQSISGYSVLKLRRTEDEDVVLDIVQPEQYFPNFNETDDFGKPTEITIASYHILNNGKKDITYLLKEIHTIGNIEWQVWRVNGKLEPVEQISSSSDIFIAIKGDDVDSQDTDLDFIPIWQIDNIKTSKEDFGKSDFRDVESLIQELNDRVTQISVQLIKHLNAKIAIPPGILDENGNVRVKDLDAIEISDQGLKPEYITNSNPQIDNGFKQIEQLIRFIASQTRVPASVIGIDDQAGQEKVEAIKIRLFDTLRKIGRKRMAIETQLKDLLRAAAIIDGNADAGIPKIIWEDPLPSDELVDTRIVVERVNAGLISKSSAIKRLDEISQEAVDDELQKIEDERAAQILAGTTPTITEL